ALVVGDADRDPPAGGDQVGPLHGAREDPQAVTGLPEPAREALGDGVVPASGEALLGARGGGERHERGRRQLLGDRDGLGQVLCTNGGGGSASVTGLALARCSAPCYSVTVLPTCSTVSSGSCGTGRRSVASTAESRPAPASPFARVPQIHPPFAVPFGPQKRS